MNLFDYIINLIEAVIVITAFILWDSKQQCSILRIIVSVFIIFLTMFLRMLGIGFLVVIAPLTAVGTLSKKSIGGGGIGQLLNFKVWIKTYLTLLLLPLGFIFAYKIILLLW